MIVSLAVFSSILLRLSRIPNFYLKFLLHILVFLIKATPSDLCSCCNLLAATDTVRNAIAFLLLEE